MSEADAAAAAAAAAARSALNIVMDQGPPGTTEAQAAAAFSESGEDIRAAIMKLWDAYAPPPATPPPRSDIQRKWDEVREIADQMDRRVGAAFTAST